ncbi:MAG: hypothetical protein IPO98_12810 [Saprospiraceae bacterium]|nr:hypothetical protein [Saprospiraceae bacterium]
MIKLFRNIRQSMLSNGQTIKYFKYAIGEIILVVIGILIALQINNWSEQNKINAKRAVYMQSLQNDLNVDVNELKKRINNINVQYKNDDAEKNRLSGAQTTEDSVLARVKRLNIFLETYAEFNNNTFNSLISSGEIDLLGPELKNELFTLNKMQEKAKQSYNIHFDKYLDNYLNFSSKYPVGRYTELDSGTLNNYLWQHNDYKEFW